MTNMLDIFSNKSKQGLTYLIEVKTSSYSSIPSRNPAPFMGLFIRNLKPSTTKQPTEPFVLCFKAYCRFLYVGAFLLVIKSCLIEF